MEIKIVNFNGAITENIGYKYSIRLIDNIRYLTSYSPFNKTTILTNKPLQINVKFTDALLRYSNVVYTTISDLKKDTLSKS